MASLSRDSGHLVPPLGPPCFLKEVLQNYGNNGNPAPQHAFIPVDLPRHPSSVPPQDPNQQSNFKEVQKEKEKNTSEALRRYQMWKNIELVHPSFEKPAFSPDPNQQTNSQEVQKGTGTEKDKPDYPEITNVTNDWIGTTNKLPLAFQLFEESMAQIIYGSNRIEDVGLNESMTRQLCAKVFRNLEAHATVFDFANPEYKEYFRGDLSKSSIVRGRRQVIQHAKAFTYLVTELALKNQLISQQLIKKTHTILYEGDGLYNSRGTYRAQEKPVPNGVTRKKTHLIQVKLTEGYMASLCENYKLSLKTFETGDISQIISLAAQLCTDVLNLRPFSAGNQRLGRLLLQALLLKHARICVPIGEDGISGVAEYLDMATKSFIIFHQENKKVQRIDQTSHAGLVALLMKKTRAKYPDIYLGK